MHSAHKLPDALQIAMTSAKESHLLDDVFVVESDVDLLRAGPTGVIDDMLHSFCRNACKLIILI